MSDMIRRKDAIKATWQEPSYTDPINVLTEVRDRINEIPAASPWHRVEDDPPDKKKDAIFYFEWTGISGTVYRETSIISLDELIAVCYRPIAWMPLPEPPKEDA